MNLTVWFIWEKQSFDTKICFFFFFNVWLLGLYYKVRFVVIEATSGNFFTQDISLPKTDHDHSPLAVKPLHRFPAEEDITIQVRDKRTYSAYQSY